MAQDFQSDNIVINLDSEEFLEKYKNDKNAVLLDVRTEDEFNDGHIPNSILIDIYSPSFPEKIKSLDKSKNYYVYCRSGNRSYHAGIFMIREGFKNVYNLTYGVLGWHQPLEN